MISKLIPALLSFIIVGTSVANEAYEEFNKMIKQIEEKKSSNEETYFSSNRLEPKDNFIKYDDKELFCVVNGKRYLVFSTKTVLFFPEKFSFDKDRAIISGVISQREGQGLAKWWGDEYDIKCPVIH